jgi:hypothetical protein
MIHVIPFLFFVSFVGLAFFGAVKVGWAKEEGRPAELLFTICVIVFAFATVAAFMYLADLHPTLFETAGGCSGE